MVFRCYSKYDEKIRLDFFPCKNVSENWAWEEWHTEIPLTIFVTDYRQLLLEYICEVYPTNDPTNHEIEQSFDECSFNFIGKDDWIKIIERIKILLKRNNNRPSKMEKEFYENFIEWVEKELKWANIIVVDGNL